MYLILGCGYFTLGTADGKPLQAKVLHEYKAQSKDEFSLKPGEIIMDVVQLEQGWCKVLYMLSYLLLYQGLRTSACPLTTSVSIYLYIGYSYI